MHPQKIDDPAAVSTQIGSQNDVYMLKLETKRKGFQDPLDISDIAVV